MLVLRETAAQINFQDQVDFDVSQHLGIWNDEAFIFSSRFRLGILVKLTIHFFRKNVLRLFWFTVLFKRIKSNVFRMKTFELIVLLVLCSAALTSGKKYLIHTQHVGFLNIYII